MESDVSVPKVKEDEAIGGPENVARRIVDYLKDYPYARDTRRGVARWWVGLPEETVAEALEYLCQRGVLTRSARNDQILYSRNPRLAPELLDKALAPAGTE